MKAHYCDKCKKEISPWDNEYGQVMAVTIIIETSDDHCPVSGGTMEFCSAACAMKFLKDQEKIEQNWLDVWRRGKILGTAPVMAKHTQRKNL